MSNVAKLMDEGETRLLQILFGAQPVDGVLYAGLYTNPTEPAEDVTLAGLTEPSGHGYARKPVTRGLWVITGDYATYPELTWLAAGGDWGNVYGYFLCTSLTGTTGKLLAIEHLASFFNVLNGKGVKVVPKITCS